MQKIVAAGLLLAIITLLFVASFVELSPPVPVRVVYQDSASEAVLCGVTSNSMECGPMKHFGGTAAAKRQTIDEIRARLEAPAQPQQPAMRVLTVDDPNHAANVKRALVTQADLSEAQMFAMMNMSGDYRHQQIWHHARLNLFELPPFTRGTFIELSERGYAEKPDGSKYHRLTLSASALADAVADELVGRHHIHAPMVIHPKGEKTKFATFRCTCNYSCALTAGGNLQAKAGRVFSSHLRSVNVVNGIAQAVRVAGEG